jgi:preprotein translocase subunit SecG
MAGKVHVKRKAGRKATKKKAKDVKKKVLGSGTSVGGGEAAAVSGLKGMSGEVAQLVFLIGCVFLICCVCLCVYSCGSSSSSSRAVGSSSIGSNEEGDEICQEKVAGLRQQRWWRRGSSSVWFKKHVR